MKWFTPAPSEPCADLSRLPLRRSRLLGRTLRAQRALRGLAAVAAALAVLQPATAAYLLAPQYAGSFDAGTGADAEFYRIQNGWRGSAVPTDGTQLGTGSSTVGSFTWGTGLWGQVDWLAVQQAAAGEVSAASGAIVQTFDGVVSAVNLGNSRFNECYSSTWGAALLTPFFTDSGPAGQPCSNAEAGDPAQQNWTARYSGFIRITNPGFYNFGVLSDDGFFFNLFGAGDTVSIGRDYLNPPDRIVGFGESLELGAGLYGFELGAWNRLGAGVVDLRWARGCAGNCAWTHVPTENLVNAAQVPEPPAVLLVLSGLLGLWTSRARLRLPRWPHSWCSRQPA